MTISTDSRKRGQ